MNDNAMSKHDHVLAGLVFSLQAGAMQQMGKLSDEDSGEVHRDLQQARATIDVLEMLKQKCRTDTPDELLRMLDSAVMNLQLNYMDELKKDAGQAAAADETPAEGTPSEEGDTDSDGDEV